MVRSVLSVSAGLFAAGVAIASVAGVDPDQPLDPDLTIRLPEGFVAEEIHPGVGPARHLTVRENGDILIARRDGRIVGLRDGDGDGVYETEERHRAAVSTGIAIRDGFLYYSNDVSVRRAPLSDALLPDFDAETVIVAGFERQRAHSDKTFAFDTDGALYVNSGAPSNACQEAVRTPFSPGRSPCDELERQGGIWRFPADRTGMSQADGERYATGARNALALAWHPRFNALYTVVHGRDSLDTLFPETYSLEDRVERPAEEFHRVEPGDDLGWPYTFWDPVDNVRRPAPEYGGGRHDVDDTGDYKTPLIGFPAHWAPNGLMFYQGDQFPADYRDGAFIAFHGSWNRAPQGQRGYRIVFVPMADGAPSGDWVTFADGFTGQLEDIRSPRDADHRPMGLAEGPDGALYIADSVKGRIWRVRWDG
ncbi:MAG: PQQ-dependent sugar dehydrogenase [Maricaulaceae bacterium]